MATRPPHKDMNDSQRKAARNIDLATDTVLAYAGREIPAMGNLTPEGLVEDLGRLNIARKLLEKTEKIIKERLKSVLPPGTEELRSDNFIMKYEARARTALNQQKAKDYLEEQGILSDFMETTAVPTMTVRETA